MKHWFKIYPTYINKIDTYTDKICKVEQLIGSQFVEVSDDIYEQTIRFPLRFCRWNNKEECLEVVLDNNYQYYVWNHFQEKGEKISLSTLLKSFKNGLIKSEAYKGSED